MTEPQTTAKPLTESAVDKAWRSTALTVLAVGLGGIIGANARWQISDWSVSHWPSSFPWGTFLINISGSFILAVYLTTVTERFAGRSLTRLLVATGLLGAYTTFSTFVYETVRLVQHGDGRIALAYIVASLAGGLVTAAIGIMIGRHA